MNIEVESLWREKRNNRRVVRVLSAPSNWNCWIAIRTVTSGGRAMPRTYKSRERFLAEFEPVPETPTIQAEARAVGDA